MTLFYPNTAVRVTTALDGEDRAIRWWYAQCAFCNDRLPLNEHARLAVTLYGEIFPQDVTRDREFSIYCHRTCTTCIAEDGVVPPVEGRVVDVVLASVTLSRILEDCVSTLNATYLEQESMWSTRLVLKQVSEACYFSCQECNQSLMDTELKNVVMLPEFYFNHVSMNVTTILHNYCSSICACVNNEVAGMNQLDPSCVSNNPRSHILRVYLLELLDTIIPRFSSAMQRARLTTKVPMVIVDVLPFYQRAWKLMSMLDKNQDLHTAIGLFVDSMGVPPETLIYSIFCESKPKAVEDAVVVTQEGVRTHNPPPKIRPTSQMSRMIRKKRK